MLKKMAIFKRCSVGLLLTTSLLLMSCAHVHSAPGPAPTSTIADQRHHYLAQLQNDHIEVIKQGETYQLVVPSDELFVEGSTNLAGQALPALKTIAHFIKTYRTTTIAVAAYSDNVQLLAGPNGRKHALTTRQAQVVASYLWNCGLNTRFAYADGDGDDNPVATNDTVQGRELNRRVEIRFRFYPNYSESTRS